MNNKYSMLAFTTFAGLLSLATGQILTAGECQNVTVIDSFDVSKYLGKWYEYSKYPIYFDVDGKCVTAEYSLNADGHVNVKNSLIHDKSNAYLSFSGSASSVASAKWLIKFPVTPVVYKTRKYWILDTDYVNYSVVYACYTVDESMSATKVWILTRKQLPDAKIIEKAIAVLKRNDISFYPLKVTHQTDCN